MTGMRPAGVASGIVDEIRAFHSDLTSIRHDLHANPELGFEEYRTADLVAAELARYGCAVHRNIGRTGVVGVLHSDSPGAISLRADMDALPIHEAGEFGHRSQKDGVMHACGHDGHTATLLGAARYLATTGNFARTINFIFQPAEEGLGGARAMLDDGLFERFPCDAVYGFHNRPGLPVGHFAMRPGKMMAGGAFFDITVTGVGTHGARPEAGIDVVLVASHITSALQSIVSRRISPLEPAVVSVTATRAGDAYNVMPQEAVLRGTARAFSTPTLQAIERHLRQIAASTAEAAGATAMVDFRYTFSPLVNDARHAAVLCDAAAGLVGEAQVERNLPLTMASEDFAFMLEARPGAYINFGNGEGKYSCPLHNPDYDFNDDALPFGAALLAAVAAIPATSD